MKRNLRLAVALTVCVAMLASCSASAVKTEYRSLGVTVHLVDTAMNAWGEYVRAGQATSDQEAAVRSAFKTYQNVAEVGKVALKASASIATPPDLQAAADAVVAIVNSFTKKPLPPVPAPTPGVTP